MSSDVQSDIDAFISRWQVASGSERANYQIFLTELCALLALPKPEPAQGDPQHNHYVFERRVVFRHGDGSESQGFIDLYRRGAFVCETKRLKQDAATRGFDDALLRARGQAEGYARALPAEEGRPPFVMVVDVGTVIELYAEFTRSGATYTPFPDPRSHRIPLMALGDPAIRQRLKLVWLDPLALDPARQSAQVTREIATRLAATAKALEAAGHAAQAVAAFLSRCLFTCFAEDVGLIPKRAFLDLLESTKATSGQFVPLVRELWQAMDTGGFSTTTRADLLRFNGKLFKDPYVLPLGRAEIELLIDAARADWRQVEPAIFGTLLESALDPDERHSLGAHYTPRAYVERLVLPTIIEPLRDDWRNAQTAALTLAAEGDLKAAITAVRDFHRRLCSVRVLDPACGSGNFLYVTLEHLKRLEGEVLNQLDALGETRGLLDLAGVSVDPHQCLGIEVNPRAAAIAELVLWIGDLQWHFRTRGHAQPTVPVLKDFNNIECRDAVLANDRIEYVLDQRGVLVTRWDGKTLKPHPVTGEPVPDERARVPLERYVNPRQAGWPEADFVVGNPPFIGAGRMRQALGDGYAEALRKSWPEVPESADFVMYWWGHAAELARAGKLRRFGLVTTNSLRQTFNRRVIERHLTAEPPLSLAFAIPDHPWVDTADGAAVRIAMTVGHLGATPGRLLVVTNEHAGGGEGIEVVLAERSGSIHADMRIGANVAGAKPLRANGLLSSMGIKLHGQGFVLSADHAQRIGWPTVSGIERVVRPYVTSRGLVQAIQPTFVIDLFGLSSEDVRRHYPAVYQWVIERVKPERDHNNRPSYRINWWIFGEPRRELRRALNGIFRYIATARTAKHRIFVLLDSKVCAESEIVCVACADAFLLGVLSSHLHVVWALAQGGTLEDRPRYNNSRCFDTFPFPAANAEQQARIRALGEELDAHRKCQQAAHPGLTLTGMYNVVEKLRSGEAFSAKEKTIHEQGLVSVLKTLHDDLDREVLAAYGWEDLAPLMNAVNGCDGAHTAPDQLDEILLERLVVLNTERAAEEARGLVRWLRPDFQNPTSAHGEQQALLTIIEDGSETVAPRAAAPRPWPAAPAEQAKAVAEVLAAASAPLGMDELAARFTGRGRWRQRLPQLVDMLVAVGRAREVGSGRFASMH